MKRLLVGLLLVLGVATSGYAEGYDAQERFSGEYAGSYASHYAIGAGIGAGTVAIIPDDFNMNEWQRWLAGIGIAVVAKGIMEVFDDNPNGYDVMEYAIGAAIGGGVVTLISIDF